MVPVADQEARVEAELGAGRLCCPSCEAPLGPWGWAGRRQIRFLDCARAMRLRRARCRDCGATHVLVPTVRNWLRRFERRAEHIRTEATRWAYLLDANLGAIDPQASPFADAMLALNVAAVAATSLLGRQPARGRSSPPSPAPDCFLRLSWPARSAPPNPHSQAAPSGGLGGLRHRQDVCRFRAFIWAVCRKRLSGPRATAPQTPAPPDSSILTSIGAAATLGGGLRLIAASSIVIELGGAVLI